MVSLHVGEKVGVPETKSPFWDLHLSVRSQPLSKGEQTGHTSDEFLGRVDCLLLRAEAPRADGMKTSSRGTVSHSIGWVEPHQANDEA